MGIRRKSLLTPRPKIKQSPNISMKMVGLCPFYTPHKKTNGEKNEDI